MRIIEVDGFDAWRARARELLSCGVGPDEVCWHSAASVQPLLPWGQDTASLPPNSLPATRFLVPRRFVEWAELAAHHRDESRWHCLYRVLWRLNHGEPRLLEVTIDDDIHRLGELVRQVRHDAHRMKAFVRFRLSSDDWGDHYVAWYRPDHRVLRLVAGFFAKRFGPMRWAILTADESCYWNTKELQFGPGVPRSAAPRGDELETLWRQYYAATFNPARVNPRLLERELPRRFHAQLPEAVLIDELVRSAPRRTEAMMRPSPPRAAVATAAAWLPADRSLGALRAAAATCRACALCEMATQTVFGHGPAGASLVLVGEQPGDEEDRAGRPFVGPAGRLLGEMLANAGIDGQSVYLTNAVKHFKHTLRGQRRIHAKPSSREQAICRPWLEAELSAIRPRLLVCLGATAAKAVLGDARSVATQRGRWQPSAWCQRTLVTYHPAALLRANPSAEAAMRRQMQADFADVAAALSSPTLSPTAAPESK